MIIGCSGSGKSTFSRELQNKTCLPLFHLDILFWNKDKTHVSREIFDERLNEILKRDSWIIDGNYSRTLEMRLKACDTVFLLDFPVDTCLDGANARIGKQRDDIPWVEQALDEEFKRWITEFPQTELPRIYSLLEKYNHKDIFIFKSRDDVDRFLEEI